MPLDLLVLIPLLCSVLAADTVVLRNSDKLTGEIVKLEQQKLHLKTDYAGTVQIEWKMVEKVVGEREMLIETDTGRRIVGRIRPASAGVEVSGAREQAVLSPLAIVRIGPRPESREGVRQRLSGGTDVGYSITRGNAKSNQYSLGFKGRYVESKWQLQGDVTSLFSTVAENSVNRHAGQLRGDYSLNGRSFAFSLANLEVDERQRLNLRSNLGGGFGYKILRSPQRQMSLLGGTTYVYEAFFDRSNTSGEALAGFSLDRLQFGRVALNTRLSVHPNLIDTGRVRLTLDGGITMPVAGRMNYNLRWFNRFDSRPQQVVQRNDYGLVSSFGVAF
jgi:putative salt-induced outer membrane protein YdiY